MAILCSGRAKTREISPFLTQKCHFCARNARKRGFQRVKAHKNLDFVLEMPENGGSEGQKSTKMPILCSGRGEFALGSVRVTFLQITAHANVLQRCLEQGFVCAMNCSNSIPGQAAAPSPIGYLSHGQASASSGGDT